MMQNLLFVYAIVLCIIEILIKEKWTLNPNVIYVTHFCVFWLHSLTTFFPWPYNPLSLSRQYRRDFHFHLMPTSMLAALLQCNIPPKMKQGGTKKPAQTAKTEENCDKLASVDRYV